MSQNPSPQNEPPTVGVVGGGLAGLAAATVLADRGVRVELFETRRHLGGRAGSYRDPQTGQTVDHCQHVGMGCCTYWMDFCRRTGIIRSLRRDRVLHFFGPDGRCCRFAGVGWLPAPLHLLPALLRLTYLSFGERIGLARTLMRLVGSSNQDEVNTPTVADWLRRHGQSDRVIQRFWEVVLASALGETVERASLPAARKVFLDGFLAHRRAYEILVPTEPLTRLYDQQAAEYLQDCGVKIHRETRVAQVSGSAQRVDSLQLADHSQRKFAHIVLAVPWLHLPRLLPEEIRGRLPQLAGIERIESSPIAGMHLWFDRSITRLPHAVFVGRLSQWLFNHGQATDSADGPPDSHYVQVVISGNRQLAQRSREDVRDEVLGDLRCCFPDMAAARLLRWQLVNQPQAVFSVRPGLELLRPPQATGVDGLHLAGDWTQTGWPATMEGAVRSGFRAAESVLSAQGDPAPCRVPDLPKALLTRLLTKSG